MISTANVVLCGIAALLLWGGPGWLLARGLTGDRWAALALAPALGWATQTPAALAGGLLLGLSVPVILGAAAALCLCAQAFRGEEVRDETPGFPPLALLLAAALALVPALAVLPKTGADGAIALAAPLYDHAKITLIDEMARASTLPPANPVYGAAGEPGVIAYYYLWHFGAAELARLTGATGWEADAAASWFSAFAALGLVAGLAFRFRPGTAAPLLALLAAAAGSLRPVASAFLGPERMDRLLEPATGLAGLLYQASWSPHHVASASAVVMAVLLMARMRAQAGRHPEPRPLAVLVVLTALVAAAAFQSSLWVGGVAFALGGAAAALVLALCGPREGRGRFLAATFAAAILAGVLVAPLLHAQIEAAALRGGGAPVRVAAFPVLGPLVPDGLRAALDLPAFWLVLLPTEFPAIVLAGAAGLALVLGARGRDGSGRRASAGALAVLALGVLAVSALLRSTAGENNDLGWRAVLPAVLVLSAFAGVALAAALAAAAQGRRAALVAALALIAIGLPDAFELARGNAVGEAGSQGRVFADDPELWNAVRREVAPDIRVASNPGRLERLTPWPVNISWALLSRRRSCFAGKEMALAFAPLTAAERTAADALFARVFAGAATPSDMTTLRTAFGCGAAVVTAQDGAWRADPFAASPLFRLASEEPGRWRIYLAAAEGAPAAAR